MKPEYKTSEAKRRYAIEYYREHKPEIEAARARRTPEQRTEAARKEKASRQRLRIQQFDKSEAVRRWMGERELSNPDAAKIFTEAMGRPVSPDTVSAYRSGYVWIPAEILTVVGYDAAENGSNI